MVVHPGSQFRLLVAGIGAYMPGYRKDRASV